VINFNQSRRPLASEPKNLPKTVLKQTAPSEFQLLHVSVLREYLEMDLCQDFHRAQRPVDVERVLDDFVFMTFLVGNDFLPHLPSLDISEGAFDRLFSTYRAQVLDTAATATTLQFLFILKKNGRCEGASTIAVLFFSFLVGFEWFIC
jgi:5'-3' exonuclease